MYLPLSPSPHVQGVAPSASIRRNHRTIYAKSRTLSSGFFPLRVFGNIKTFTVEFDIPCAELSVQMEIRGTLRIEKSLD